MINISFSLRLWLDHIKPADPSNLRMVTKQSVHIDGIILMFVRTGDFRVRAWFEVVEKLAVDVVFGTLFIYRCIGGIYSQ